MLSRSRNTSGSSFQDVPCSIARQSRSGRRTLLFPVHFARPLISIGSGTVLATPISYRFRPSLIRILKPKWTQPLVRWAPIITGKKKKRYNIGESLLNPFSIRTYKIFTDYRLMGYVMHSIRWDYTFCAGVITNKKAAIRCSTWYRLIQQVLIPFSLFHFFFTNFIWLMKLIAPSYVTLPVFVPLFKSVSLLFGRASFSTYIFGHGNERGR